MKLRQEKYFEDLKIAKLVEIEGKEITINEAHSFITDGERKIIFTIKGNKENYFYFPASMVGTISDEMIELINNGDYPVGRFDKKEHPKKKGQTMWVFTDKED